ncbi:hypothetical protein B0H17DRAFT_371885 [Mycena rosella]|uniref:Uncharacterized protein n=1 Tax=Mycena rosella TaxID=1033263 RepID=A0AAD7GM36_MYCRO|nr:hypothetical protein B0H17DRAFT_371885 [Mycena rosella]
MFSLPPYHSHPCPLFLLSAYTPNPPSSSSSSSSYPSTSSAAHAPLASQPHPQCGQTTSQRASAPSAPPTATLTASPPFVPRARSRTPCACAAHVVAPAHAGLRPHHARVCRRRHGRGARCCVGCSGDNRDRRILDVLQRATSPRARARPRRGATRRHIRRHHTHGRGAQHPAHAGAPARDAACACMRCGRVKTRYLSNLLDVGVVLYVE